jgi:hypothetical protein
MHYPPAESNFCDEHGNALKPAIIQDYNGHMRYIDKSDHMMNTYSTSKWTRKWTKRKIFPLLNLMLLNSCILLTSCYSKLLHSDFWLSLVRTWSRRVEECFKQGLHLKKHQPFLPDSWTSGTFCTGQVEVLHVFWGGGGPQPDILPVCEVQCGVVYCAMLPDLPHPTKILRSTPQWGKADLQLNWSKQWVKHYILRYTDLCVLHGIWCNCHSSGRNLLLYLFIKRGIRLIVRIIEESPSYQLPTKFYLTFFWPG